jgi:molybdopterin synthase catalytic subunit
MGAVSDPLLVSVTSEPLSVDSALTAVADPGAGGTCVFVGTVRDRSDRVR